MFLPNGVHIYFANPSLETFERIDGAEIEAPPSLAGLSKNHCPRACWYRPPLPFKQAL